MVVFLGDVFVMECASKEMVGIALACDLPVSVDKHVWEDFVAEVQLTAVKPLGVDRSESVTDSKSSIELTRLDDIRFAGTGMSEVQ